MKRLWWIARRADTEPVEVGLGLVTLVWGLWLLSPLLATVDPSTWEGPGVTLSARLVGGVLLAVGVAALWGVLADRHGLRRHAAFGAIVIWSFVSVLFIPAVAEAMATAQYPALCAAHVWLYLRLSEDRLE